VRLFATRGRVPSALIGAASWRAARDGVLHGDAEITLAGCGEMLKLEIGPLDQIAADSPAIRAVEEIELRGDEGPRGSLPRCHVALPFRPDGASHAVIPSIQLTGTRDGVWMTVVSSAPQELDVLRDAALHALDQEPPPDIEGSVRIRQITETPSAEEYAARVAMALEEFETGLLRKVVLARSVSFEATDRLDPAAVVARMKEREPSCTLYAQAGEHGGRLVGASPELLIARQGTSVTSHPLAGTLSLSDGSIDSDALLSSSKDLDEHRLVVDDLAERLRPHLTSLEVPLGPSLVTLRSVAHLGTLIEGSTRGDDTDPHILELLRAIHPTPAVGGVPLQAALDAIERLEGPRRDYFAGAIGWFDSAGDGEWVLGIRGATLNDTRCSMSAGAGIVRNSTPAGEADETRAKLASVLEAVAPGSSELLSRSL